MKKVFLILSAVLLLSVLSVIAQGTETSIKLVQKNPSDWSVVQGGFSSTLFLYQMMEVQWLPCSWNKAYNCKTYGYVDYYSVIPTGKVKPNTSYTLVYYGFDSHNDEWNYVTCIQSKNSGSYGYLNFGGKYKWTSFLNDGLNQKFWIVPTADLDCANNKFVAWNPSNILFETRTI